MLGVAGDGALRPAGPGFYRPTGAYANAVQVDEWESSCADGQTIAKAVDVLLPAATAQAAWPYPETDFRAWEADDVIHAAADAGDRRARTALPLLTPPPGGDLWPLRPAAQLLSSDLF